MQAIISDSYGSASNLKLQEIAKPKPASDEVLVKIHASAVNDYDWSIITGRPKMYRLLFGLRKPKNPVPGMELSGVVEEIGEKVVNFNIGDAVFGDTSDYGFGTFAEYICLNEKALTLKPDSITFEEAATIPHASLLAKQGLIDIGKITHGQKILINGAGGGVGSFGLQIAKLFDANVTGVDTGDKLETMKALGFDHVIDYKKQDFTRTGETYDLILDAKTTRAPSSYARSLNKNGKYVTVGGKIGRLLQMVLYKKVFSLFHKKSVQVLALKPNLGLDFIIELFEKGQIKTVIDGPYSLNETPKAIQRFGEAKHAGKVVIKVC